MIECSMLLKIFQGYFQEKFSQAFVCKRIAHHFDPGEIENNFIVLGHLRKEFLTHLSAESPRD